MKTIITILSVLLLISVGLNIYWYNFPMKEKIKGDIVYLPGEKVPTVIYNLPDGSQSATAKKIKDYQHKTQEARELFNDVKAIPNLENIKQIASLTEAKMKLELNLSESQMIINDKEKQLKTWQDKDKYNTVTIDNLNNTAKVQSEISPIIATTEKREKFLGPKEQYTTITSPNTSAKFYGVQSYTFKNPRPKDFVELNLKAQGLYLNKRLIPYGGAELLFNPDGKLKPIVGYGYFYENQSGKMLPYWMFGLQFNLIRF